MWRRSALSKVKCVNSAQGATSQNPEPLGRDAEEADVEKERIEQAKGPAHRAHELDELAKIYESRGVSPGLARMVRPAPWRTINQGLHISS